MKGIRVWLSAAVLSIACPTLSLSAGQGDGPGVPDRRHEIDDLVNVFIHHVGSVVFHFNKNPFGF